MELKAIAGEGRPLLAWCAQHRDEVLHSLDAEGALLFRGFAVGELEDLVMLLAGEAMGYEDGSSPRTRVSGNIYTSTEYSANQTIFLHCELAYAFRWPMKLFFLCLEPASAGGQTTLADTRRVLERVPPELAERNLCYVRNYGEGFGVRWEAAFGTASRERVEALCREGGMAFEWHGDRLRTRVVRPAVARHPRTGERVWFNHLALFHPSTLAPSVRRLLSLRFAPEEFPNTVFYEDGSVIPDEVAEAVRQAFLAEKRLVEWQAGDMLLVDNMLAAHGREAYQGERRVVLGMGEPCTRA